MLGPTGVVGGSTDLVEVLEALLRGRKIGSNDEISERLDEDNPVLLLDDADDLDLEDLDERLVCEMRRGIEQMDSCEGCGMGDVWLGVSGGSKIAACLLFSLILR